MAEDLGALIVKLQADIAELKSGLQEGKSQLSDFKSQAQDFGSSVKSALTIAASALGIYELGSALKSTFKSGIEAINQFQLTTIGVAAIIADMAKDQTRGQANYAAALAYSKDMFQELELAAAHHFASGAELVQGWNIMAQKGVILRKEEIEYMGIIVDRIKLATQGQVASLQVAQELRSIMSGQARQTDQIALMLRDRFGAEWKKIVDQVRETGSFKPLADVFAGLGYANKDIEKSLEAQRTTLYTLLTQVGRGGLQGAYEDIVGLTRRMNEFLTTQKDEIIDKIVSGWVTIETKAHSVKETLSWINDHAAMKIPEDPSQRTFGETVAANFHEAFYAALDFRNLIDKISFDLSKTYEWAKRINNAFVEWAALNIEKPFIEAKSILEGIDAVIYKIISTLNTPITWDIVVNWISSRSGPIPGHGPLTSPHDYEVRRRELIGKSKGEQYVLDASGQRVAITTNPVLPETTKGKGGKDEGADKSRVSAWQSELEEMKIAEGNFFNFSKERELDFWRDKLEIAKAGGKGQADEVEAIKHRIFSIEQAAAKENIQKDLANLKLQQESAKTTGEERLRLQEEILRRLAATYGKDSKEYLAAEQQKVKIAREVQQEKLKLAQDRILKEAEFSKIDLDIERENARFKTAMGGQTEAQEIGSLIALKQQEHQIERRALLDQIEIWKEYPKEKAELDNQLMVMDKKYSLETLRLNNQRTLALKQQWDQLWGSVSRAFTMSLQGIIQGTTTLSDALKNLWQSILSSFIEMLMQMMMQWVSAQIFQLLFGKMTAVGQITAQSGIAYILNVVSLIPLVGPFAAPGIAAGLTASELATALGMSMASAAGGWWEVPDTTMTTLHRKEQVLPAWAAEGLRNLITGQGTPGAGAGAPITVHVHVKDAMDQSQLNRVAEKMVKAINIQQSRHGKPLLGAGY